MFDNIFANPQRAHTPSTVVDQVEGGRFNVNVAEDSRF